MSPADKMRSDRDNSKVRPWAIVAAAIAVIVCAILVSQSGWFELRPASGTAAAMADAADRPLEGAR